MKKGGTGGGNTVTGIHFETKVDFLTALDTVINYTVRKAGIGFEVLYGKDVVASSYKKHDFYKFLESEGVEWQKIISKKLLPDDAIYVIKDNTLYILEVKHQEVAGSVDEKLQTCDFKKKQYQKLMSQLNREVEYIYILDNWFRDERYKDVLDYVISVGCQYYFEYLPLHKIGLPVPEQDN
jgi:hypothetical protein